MFTKTDELNVDVELLEMSVLMGGGVDSGEDPH